MAMTMAMLVLTYLFICTLAIVLFSPRISMYNRQSCQTPFVRKFVDAQRLPTARGAAIGTFRSKEDVWRMAVFEVSSCHRVS